MLRVLTLSTLFPDASRPAFGVFVERQTLELAAHPGVALQVVAPRGLPPGPLAWHPHYRALSALPEQEEWKGLTVHRPRFPVLPLLPGRWTAPLLTQALMPLLRRIRADFPFDVIDAEFFFPDGPAAERLARGFDVPFSVKARGADIHHWGARAGTGPQIVRAGRAAQGLLTVSAALRADMIALGMGENIRIHYTGVDLARFLPLAGEGVKARLGIAGPLLVTAGHLIPRKGQIFAVDALARLPGATLVLIGDGPDRQAIEARVAALGLGERVRLMGALPHDALPPLLAAADVLVQPSSSEGLANVWVEALASGTPVVTTDVGGAREVIDRPAAGRLVARDAGAIAAAAAALFADMPSPDAVRACAERFTWVANRDSLYAHLSALVREPKRSTSH